MQRTLSSVREEARISLWILLLRFWSSLFPDELSIFCARRCSTVFPDRSKETSAFERDDGLATYWRASGVALTYQATKESLEIEPDALRCDDAPTDEECVPGIATQIFERSKLYAMGCIKSD